MSRGLADGEIACNAVHLQAVGDDQSAETQTLAEQTGQDRFRQGGGSARRVEGEVADVRRQEDVDSSGNGCDNVAWGADAHEVAGPIRRQQRGGERGSFDHLAMTFADAESADGITGKAKLGQLFGTVAP